MHYEEHEVFTPPTDSNATIWRYIDFTKLVSMLETQALYFARSDTLGDDFEGSYSTANIRWRPEAYKDVPQMTAQMELIRRQIRQHTYVSCWNLSEHESAALWGLYVPPQGGVAIRSTFRRLSQAFLPSPEDEVDPPTGNTVFVGKIRYADYDDDLMPENNMMWPFVYKRRSFEFENELRALIQHIPVVPVPGGAEGELVASLGEPSPLGRGIAMDLEALIEAVVVSPLAPHWFSELVQGVCARYGLSREVVSSGLSGSPVY
jgi:hypothetical protein